MIFFKPGRKNGRPGSGVYRPQPLAKNTLKLTRRSEVLLLVVTYGVLVTSITRPPEISKRNFAINMDPQRVAMDEICSDIEFKTEDLEATKAERDKEAAKIPNTYRVDRERVGKQIHLLNERIEALTAKRDEVYAAIERALKASNSSQDEWDVVAKAVTAYAARLKEDPAYKSYPEAHAMAAWLMPESDSIPARIFKTPPKNNPGAAMPVMGLKPAEVHPLEFAYADELAKLSREQLDYVLSSGVTKPDLSEKELKKTITIIRDNPVGDLKVSEDTSFDKVPNPKTAGEALAARIADAAKNILSDDADHPVDWGKMQLAALEMAQPLVTDTLFYDQVFTESARERARLAVAPVMKQVHFGELLQPSHRRWTPQSLSDVKTYLALVQSDHKPNTRMLIIVAAQMLFVALVMACMVRAVQLLTPFRERQHMLRNLNLVFLIMCATLVLGRLVSYFEPTGFVLPVAAGAILLAILINPLLAVMSSMLTAALVSIQFNYDWRLLFVMCAMSTAGVFGMYRIRRRSDMAKTAFKATMVGLLAVIAVTLAMDSIVSWAAGRRLLLVLLSGGACFLIVPGVLSPLERLFNITTDIQLLEYSDLNNEVMSRMAIEIPATYAHSLMLGQLAEAAADAVNANGLLARVIAYYHDIGKLKRPEYYSENQNGTNIHDELSPRLSARAIACHVMCGVELAQEYHLPQVIINGIREHHGTCLIGFFYQKALDQNKHDDVREEDFRYPGPKPQTRETAIIMICDAVESGVRSIKNPNEDRVRDFIDKVITSRSNDRQFDECPLTLKDLDIIKEAVTRRMVTALHTRVAYPEAKQEKRADNVISLSGGVS